MPALERGILRWPSHRALLLINRCQLLVLEAFGPSEEPVTLQGNRAMVEARSAVHQAMAAARHPLLPMALGYIHLAQGLQGLPGAGDRACVLVEPVFKTFPSGASPRFALAVALRLRGRPGDLARALGLLDDAQETARLDPEWGVYRAMILAAMGRMEEATRQREKALARQPLLAGHPVWAIWPRGSERGVGNHPGP